MEITRFIVERRNDALVVGDYGIYRKALSRRILTLRRRLGRTTAKGRKYIQKAPITSDDVTSDIEFIHLQILASERAWAHAMYMKSIHSNESDQAITGTMRRHILSRLEKARKIAASLVDAIRQMNSSSADKLLLEAEAYQSLLSGTLFFEARKWSRSLEEYSITHVVYTNLVKVPSKQVESIQELLSSTIEPSIRYAAYQQKISRTVPIPQIVSKHLKKDSPTIQTLLKVDPECFDELSDRVESGRDGRILPKIINWRTRSVPIEDAAIAEALANVYEAEANFAKAVASVQPSPKEKAAAYDAILVPSQDAVDAAKTAIEELVSEGVPAADKRLQALQVTRTALSYDLISNRIGRYRVLCGSADGLNLEPSGRKGKAETINSKMTKLRECVVLYDSILQSLESINELPGVAADQALVKELDSKKAYFTTLRSISIARSHSIRGNNKNALALFANAVKNACLISSTDPDTDTIETKVLGIEITHEQAQHLQKFAQGLLTQHHAIVELQNIQQEEIKAESNRRQGSTPFIERLDEYPSGGVDLTNLVDYPPKLKLIPVKPIFLDVAWNYIIYPGKIRQTTFDKDKNLQGEGSQPERKRGWWGFSRS